MTTITSFQIDETLHLTPLSPAEATGACGEPDARLWLDLQASGRSELGEWLDKLAVTGLARKLCLEARNRPGLYPLKTEIVLVIPVLTNEQGSNDVDFLALVCRENLLLTLHEKPLPLFADTDDSESWLSERSIAALVSAVMVDVSLAALRRTEDLRSRILTLEQKMDREPDSVDADEILDLRSEVVELASIVSDQLPSLQALSTTDRTFFRLGEAQQFMNCALVNLRAAEGSLSWLDQRVAALRSEFQMHAQEKTNSRLGMLTILSAIFMPITLLAGIWGMNFEAMPELKYAFAYPLALGFMVIVGIGMYLFFRRTGWFD